MCIRDRFKMGAMENLVPLVNDLQDIFNGLGFHPIQLPQICTLGGQSAGKSSVLESIVGKDFLPRGSGIVTRRPLLLQLVNPHKSEWEESVDEISGEPIWVNSLTGEKRSTEPERPTGGEEYGEFLHVPDKKWFNFTDIMNEIERFTEETCPNQTVSPEPITLKIVSPDVLTMTLVDLPGMTRNPVGGQPESIMKDINAMVEQYISNENCIILAISPANQDLANSDALAMARKHDPSGVRTIGVLTKLDLMDQGTDASDMLDGREYPLRLGYVGVVNRSQKAINERQPMKVAFADERKFFEQHSAYLHMANRMGTQFLSKTINKVLVNTIKDKLPAIRHKIMSMAAAKEEELKELGGDMILDGDAKKYMLLKCLNSVGNDFRKLLDGTSDHVSVTEAMGGAKIRQIFSKFFHQALQDLIKKGRDEWNKKMPNMLQNVQGVTRNIFAPERLFEVLVRSQTEKYREPAKACARHVHDELNNIINDLPSPELNRFVNLRENVVQVISSMLQSRLSASTDMINTLLDMELGHINTEHPDFVAGSAMQSLYEADADAYEKSVGTHAADDIDVPEEQSKYRTHMLTVVFDHLDKNKDGAVDIEEIKKWGEDLRGKPYTPEEVDKILESFDADQDKQITLEEWLKYHKVVIPAAFTVSQFDKSLENYLPKKTLTEMTTRLPAVLKHEAVRSQDDVKKMILMKRMVVDYINIVTKTVQDSVPKCIMLLMVNDMANNVHDELLKSLYDESLMDDLLEEDPEIDAQRRRCKQMVTVLRKACEVLNTVNDKTV
eukprot:TRINITY_DN761_c0_g1_i1.p1 TRINITY_DN761_c0_g1~~TRINITY_DN761_c0_g1_i1.p1  ORF type:complete len:782 (+),score=241.73 TRINITY_DN761_c0_g1_i1:134-2479(+)